MNNVPNCICGTIPELKIYDKNDFILYGNESQMPLTGLMSYFCNKCNKGGPPVSSLKMAIAHWFSWLDHSSNCDTELEKFD